MKLYFLLILFTQNNIFITLTNFKGEVIIWKSLGELKIKGLRKLTNSFLKTFLYSNLNSLKIHKNLKIHVKLKGHNKSKKVFTRFLLLFLQELTFSLIDNSNESMNGCKIKKNRRL
uniref:Ribosomal protein S11 n=1 Tax=Symphyocladiella dendroidea TaxID=2506487 RepID=UPI0022FD40D1|nr:Ribosomal protein S11 [Symphyocladiella dendroidea]WAX04029.1 Ribosomal protein S11 [Symphyocladiella dendroidea]